jgi:hypothetical protein
MAPRRTGEHPRLLKAHFTQLLADAAFCMYVDYLTWAFDLADEAMNI